MVSGLLIINADDFGENPGTTRGILEGIDAGVVTSTTILANMPGTEEALRLARQRAGVASFGVHLNLCEGTSLAGVGGARTLVDASGAFRSKRTQALRAVARRLDLVDVAREFDAQISRVRDAGVAISHLDSHKHLHQLPGVASVVLRLAVLHGITRIRCTLEEGLWPRGLPLVDAASRIVRTTCARALAPRARAAGLRFPARTLDVAELMRADGPGARLRMLVHPASATELVCHPGRGDTAGDDLLPAGARARVARRVAELDWLLGGELRVLARDAGLRVGRYDEL
jgi:predicted glycoside hydrolase/deacetylase ChbG (UPF0249 family)